LSRYAKAIMEELDEAECLRLASQEVIGRIAYSGRYDLTVLPVNYRIVDGAVVFRTGQDSLTGADLRTGIADADYRVAFEIDHLNEGTQEGWSVLIQGPAHHLDAGPGEAEVQAGIQPWAGGKKEHFIQITPARVTGRRICRPV
jgi:nitroimidazol reductase NimA-like FMN-containing flavoprotein (pyridoxamine 5'-phosphate oxidase superfamily)